MAKRISYDVIGYGEWIRPRMRDFREQCCDCGLIHRLDFRIVDDNEGARPPTKGRSHSRLHRDSDPPRRPRHRRRAALVQVHPRRMTHAPRRLSPCIADR
jgi:hypothetical protein